MLIDRSPADRYMDRLALKQQGDPAVPLLEDEHGAVGGGDCDAAWRKACHDGKGMPLGWTVVDLTVHA
jgi:hypothetical protein